jgi:hypothetical protein
MSRNLYNLERKFTIDDGNLLLAEESLKQLVDNKDYYYNQMKRWPIEIVSKAGFRYCGYKGEEIDTLIQILLLKIKLFKERGL